MDKFSFEQQNTTSKSFQLEEGALVRIKDVLKAKKLYNKYLIFGQNITSVSLMGTIISHEFCSNNTKIVFYLDDGKNVIRCMINNEPNKDEINLNKVFEAKETSVEDAEKEMQRITVERLKTMLKSFNNDKIQRGSFVKLYGKLREYKSEPYIFVEQITYISNIKDRVFYLERFQYLCEELYEKYDKTQVKPQT